MPGDLDRLDDDMKVFGLQGYVKRLYNGANV